jgi:hypothetical protein
MMAKVIPFERRGAVPGWGAALKELAHHLDAPLVPFFVPMRHGTFSRSNRWIIRNSDVLAEKTKMSFQAVEH